MSRRLLNGSVHSGCGTFVVVNDEGWILTAGHIVQDLMTFPQHCIEKKAYDDACAAIEHNAAIPPKQRRKQIEKLPKNYEWTTNQACLWGCLGSPQLMNVTIDPLADLAVFRLEASGSIVT